MKCIILTSQATGIYDGRHLIRQAAFTGHMYRCLQTLNAHAASLQPGWRSVFAIAGQCAIAAHCSRREFRLESPSASVPASTD